MKLILKIHTFLVINWGLLLVIFGTVPHRNTHQPVVPVCLCLKVQPSACVSCWLSLLTTEGETLPNAVSLPRTLTFTYLSLQVVSCSFLSSQSSSCVLIFNRFSVIISPLLAGSDTCLYSSAPQTTLSPIGLLQGGKTANKLNFASSKSSERE